MGLGIELEAVLVWAAAIKWHQSRCITPADISSPSIMSLSHGYTDMAIIHIDNRHTCRTRVTVLAFRLFRICLYRVRLFRVRLFRIAYSEPIPCEPIIFRVHLFRIRLYSVFAYSVFAYSVFAYSVFAYSVFA